MDISRVQLLTGFLLNKYSRPHSTISTVDGVTIFTLATGEHPGDVNITGAYAAEVFAQAILRAERYTKPMAGTPTISQ